MSELEAHVGKLKKVDTNGLSTEEWCHETMKSHGFKALPSWCNNWKEALLDEYYGKYHIHHDVVYSVEAQEFDPNDYASAHYDENGDIEFVVSFYNGGVGFDEMLYEAIKTLPKGYKEK